MLDSLNHAVRDADEHVQSTYDLLAIRLRDKADIIATSDIVVKRLLPYYERKGSNAELQEVYYYAGSVYRDLKDTPRSLEYFLKSAETARSGTIDSLMLRNTYSQLSSLYFNVQDYKNALDMALCQCRVAEQMGVVDAVTLSQIAISKLRAEGFEKAKSALDSTFSYIVENNTGVQDTDVLSDLLYAYSRGRDTAKAKKCHDMLADMEQRGLYRRIPQSWAPYYVLTGAVDSAIWCYQQVLEQGDLERSYDAAKRLHEMYRDRGEEHLSLQYARKYIQISSELNLGKRQELAATVNNLHTYHRDLQEERNLETRAMRSQRAAWGAILASALGILAIALYVVVRKNKDLERLVSAERKLADARKETEMVRNELDRELAVVDKLKTDIRYSREQIDLLHSEKNSVEEKLQAYQKQLDSKGQEVLELTANMSRVDEDNKMKSKMLAEKMEQNKMLFRLLHQSELENTSEEIIHTIREASKGRHVLSSQDWRQFLDAIDNVYPRFHEVMLQRLGKANETQIRVCYLMKAGIVNSQIQNLVSDVSRATIWRWVKKFGEELGDALYDKN